MEINNIKTLDVNHQGSQFTINAVQNDVRSRAMTIMIQSNGMQVLIDKSQLVRLYVAKPDGNEVYQTATVNDDGTVTVNITPQALTAGGDALCQLKIFANESDGTVLYSPTFTIFVGENTIDAASIVSTDEYSALTDTEVRAEQAIKNLEDALVSGDFNGKSAYQIAVDNGFVGTEQEWLESLQGKDVEIDDSVISKTTSWSSDKIANEVDKAKNLVVTTTQNPLGGFTCDYSSSEIRNALISNRLVEMHFEDTIENSGNQVYPFLKFKDNVAYFRRVQVLSSYTRQIDIMVNYDKSVTFEEHKFYGVPTYFASCYDDAEALKEFPNKWYIPKTMPKPNTEVGTMISVQWVNGRVDGIGYDVQLIWGEPDGVGNEVILDKTNTSGAKNGVNIPTGGTITYQLVESNGRKHWKYVDGELIPQSYSSATLADVPDKVVPNLDTNYLPGMEIYLQLDNGNTAEVMNIVPSEGATLPVYGNGLGTKTGDIEKGYILHLKNAGNYWQILNGGGSSKPSGEVWETIVPKFTIETAGNEIQMPINNDKAYKKYRIVYENNLVNGSRQDSYAYAGNNILLFTKDSEMPFIIWNADGSAEIPNLNSISFVNAKIIAYVELTEMPNIYKIQSYIMVNNKLITKMDNTSFYTTLVPTTGLFTMLMMTSSDNKHNDAFAQGGTIEIQGVE